MATPPRRRSGRFSSSARVMSRRPSSTTSAEGSFTRKRLLADEPLLVPRYKDSLRQLGLGRSESETSISILQKWQTKLVARRRGQQAAVVVHDREANSREASGGHCVRGEAHVNTSNLTGRGCLLNF